MAKVRNGRQFTFFRRTLLWYLASVAVFIILCCVVFIYVGIMERQEVIEDQTSALRQVGENLDRLNRSVRFGADLVRSNKDINRFMLLNKDETRIYPIREAALSLGDIYLDDQIFDGFYLYDAGKEIIFLGQSASARLEEFYPDFYAIGGYDYEDWRSRILAPLTTGKYLPASLTRINYLEGRRIPYIASILSEAGMHIGQAVFFIKESVVLQNLQLATDIGASIVCVTDNATGQVIASTDYQVESLAFLEDPAAQTWTVNGRTGMIIRYHAAGMPWTYQAIIPVSVVVDSLMPLVRILTIILIVMLLIGGALSLVFAYLYSSPFQRLLDKLRPVLPGAAPHNHFDYMNEGISMLLASRETLEKSTARQKELLAETFLLRLKRGGFDEDQDIEQALEHLEITLAADHFRGILISLRIDDHDMSLDQLDRLDAQRAMLAEVLRNHPQEVLLHSVFSSRTVAVLYADRGQPEQCAAFCSRLYEILNRQFDTPTWYYVGVPVDSLSKVNESFAAAEQLYYFRLSDVERYVNMADEQSGQAHCEFTLDDERRLLSYAATGDKERIIQLIDDIYQANFGRYPLNALMTRLLIDSMTNTLIKAVDQKLLIENRPEVSRKLEDQIARITQSHSPAAAFALMKNAYADVCDMVLQKKKNQSVTLINEILDYISRNYADANLSLEMAAYEFGITCPYLSSFFKEHYGENFSVYLEQTRIRKANEIMTGQDLAIKEVAEKVGYTNVYTFRRAYARVMGYSPSQHKHVERRTKS